LKGSVARTRVARRSDQRCGSGVALMGESLLKGLLGFHRPDENGPDYVIERDFRSGSWLCEKHSLGHLQPLRAVPSDGSISPDSRRGPAVLLTSESGHEPTFSPLSNALVALLSCGHKTGQEYIMRASARKSATRPRTHKLSGNEQKRRLIRTTSQNPRRRFLSLAAGAAALPAVTRIAWAQTYPARPVRWFVGVAAA
jgi:hypothetical protein